MTELSEQLAPLMLLPRLALELAGQGDLAGRQAPESLANLPGRIGRDCRYTKGSLFPKFEVYCLGKPWQLNWLV